MLQKFIKSTISVGLCAALMGGVAANAQGDRACTSQKGSLLILPKVSIQYDASGALTEDTFISLSNDGSSDVFVKIYYVNGDGCSFIDQVIRLTAEEPFYWSLNQPAEANASGQTPRPFTQVGAPTMNADGTESLKGFVLIWAVSDISGNNAIRYNFLSAKVTTVNYANETAYEYNPYAFQATVGSNGSVIDSSGELLIGSVYQAAPGRLLLDFFADGSEALSNGTPVSITTDLSLLPLEIRLTNPVTTDARLPEKNPIESTLAEFVVHNQNEVLFTWPQDYCVLCWSHDQLSDIRSDVFTVEALGTNRGKARIDGVENDNVCGEFIEDPDDPNEPRVAILESRATALLGVAVKNLSFAGGSTATAASALVGQGFESALIIHNAGSIDPGDEATGDDNGSSFGSNLSGDRAPKTEKGNTIEGLFDATNRPRK